MSINTTREGVNDKPLYIKNNYIAHAELSGDLDIKI